MAETTIKAWFLYIVRCADGSLYTGITNDVPRRSKQHNAGTASRYTRSRLPVNLIYQESQPSRSVALKRELAVKSMSRKEKESLIRLGRQGTSRERIINMARQGHQTARKPATKFAHLRKKMEKARLVKKISKRK
jgi:predicted GIY-YIG superfamily endonuclease